MAAVEGTRWSGIDTRLLGLATAIEGLMRSAGRPKPHEAGAMAFAVGEFAGSLADLSEAISGSEGARLDEQTRAAYSAAVAQLRAAVAGLQRGGNALRPQLF